MIKRTGSLFFVLLLWCSPLMAITNVPPLNENELDMVFFNVPHGEASLMTNHQGKHILVNTASERSQKQLFEQLSSLQVDKIETIIITNQSEEYTGNLEYFLEHYQVERVIIPENMVMNRRHVEVDSWKPEKPFTIWNQLDIQPLDVTTTGDISFLMRFGDESILFLNDEDTKVEERLIQQTGDIDILKVAAFGSGSSPSQRFLEQIDPYMSIIFPSQTHKINASLIERLNATWIDVYFLKQTGTVFVRLNEDDYEILSENSSVS
ncbi:hydrolase [Gracilibacillus sp. S3-1-1]|uniref:Hydrolase n=1 Tax=Gracilibacillus pellucidus TaxID=3095368 RepID=A0ACC6M5H7_9BACI|nr:hydrolase [Gracilibacillus sp. S3-1-1]MDX8046143.1 hydrolase [Gracilibacillus sp. S3-1-1]